MAKSSKTNKKDVQAATPGTSSPTFIDDVRLVRAHYDQMVSNGALGPDDRDRLDGAIGRLELAIANGSIMPVDHINSDSEDDMDQD